MGGQVVGAERFLYALRTLRDADHILTYIQQSDAIDYQRQRWLCNRGSVCVSDSLQPTDVRHTTRSLRKKPSHPMPFPHPQSRNYHQRKEYKPSRWRILWKFFEGAIKVAEYWDCQDDVNPANDRTRFGHINFHDQISFRIGKRFE